MMMKTLVTKAGNPQNVRKSQENKGLQSPSQKTYKRKKKNKDRRPRKKVKIFKGEPCETKINEDPESKSQREKKTRNKDKQKDVDENGVEKCGVKNVAS